MARPAHDPEALAKFQDGERRLVYARHKADPEADLYFLADGTATEIRPWAKEHLECFMPDCPERALKTVSRKRGRDGFSHMPGAGGHGLESLFHEQGKALIARWVAERHPEVRAVIEQATLSRERRSDVMLTWESGQQVAVEVQYAALSPAAWRARHESYRNQGIVDVWLFGHIRPHLREAKARSWETAEGVAGSVVLAPVHYEVLEAGLPLLWLNPISEEIGTAWEQVYTEEYGYPGVDVGADGPWEVMPRWTEYGDRRAKFGADPLAACTLAPDGIRSPLVELLGTNADALAAVETERARLESDRLAVEAAREANREAKRQREREAAAQARRSEQALDAERARQEKEFQTWWAAQQTGYRAAWEASREHAWLIDRYGLVPSQIAAACPPHGGVLAQHEHWHTVLYRALIADQMQGHRWTVADAYRSITGAGLRLHPTNATRRGSTVGEYLRYLSRQNLIRLVRPRGSQKIEYVEVIADIEREEANQARLIAEVDAREEALRLAREQRLETRLEHEARMVQLRASIASRATGTGLDGLSAMMPSAASTMPNEALAAAKVARKYTCLRCHLPLDPVLADHGRHIGC